MKTLFLDLETYCRLSIKKVGTFRYAQDAKVLLFAYAIDDEDPKVWDVTEEGPCPDDLAEALADEDVLCVAHNAMFDFTVLGFNGIHVPFERRYCTMARALAHSLPGRLGQLCEIMGVELRDAKLETGKDLVDMFSGPTRQKVPNWRAVAEVLAETHDARQASVLAALYRAYRVGGEEVEPAIRKVYGDKADSYLFTKVKTRETHPEEWELFKTYAASDVRAARALYHKLPSWNFTGREIEYWRLDQKINARGFAVDLDLAWSALRAIEAVQERIAGQVSVATGGRVTKATQVAKFLKYMQEEHGLSLPNLKKNTLERVLGQGGVAPEAQRLLSLRLDSSRAATSKYKALLANVNADGRLRGALQFCGASRTGRDAGRTFQPQNLFRPTMENDDIEAGIAALKRGEIPDNTLELCANALRGCIVPSPGKKLVVADLSNIEGRFAAWIAGEDWKLEAFRAYDRGEGEDLYKVAYGRAFRVPPSGVTKEQRQIGKVMELMLQFEGGVGAFVKGAEGRAMDLEALADLAWASVPKDIQEEAENHLEWAREQGRSAHGLSDRAFMTCEGLKRLWRRAHPRICAMWRELRGAYLCALEEPDKAFPAGDKVRGVRNGAWLRLRLPSGRCLCYPGPKAGGEEGKVVLSYQGLESLKKNPKWVRLGTYGGKLFENVVQAVARDVFFSAMPALEALGYEVVLRVHDEYVTEVPEDGPLGVEGLCALMATLPPWADGLPLAAGGFESDRYRKD
jgi:DNA polymerase